VGDFFQRNAVPPGAGRPPPRRCLIRLREALHAASPAAASEEEAADAADQDEHDHDEENGPHRRKVHPLVNPPLETVPGVTRPSIYVVPVVYRCEVKVTALPIGPGRAAAQTPGAVPTAGERGRSCTSGAARPVSGRRGQPGVGLGRPLRRYGRNRHPEGVIEGPARSASATLPRIEWLPEETQPAPGRGVQGRAGSRRPPGASRGYGLALLGHRHPLSPG
jgi:hypothetical protein